MNVVICDMTRWNSDTFVIFSCNKKYVFLLLLYVIARIKLFDISKNTWIQSKNQFQYLCARNEILESDSHRMNCDIRRHELLLKTRGRLYVIMFEILFKSSQFTKYIICILLIVKTRVSALWRNAEKTENISTISKWFY